MFVQFVLVCMFMCKFVSLSMADDWHSKSQCTQKEFANHMEISCQSNQWILVGWSHYGTKKIDRTNSTTDTLRCEPSETDCIMDYTHKIAELCNGVSKCEIILTQQFIHKCADEATYLFVSYQCIDNSTIVDVCSDRTLISSTGLHLISPSFPNEYSNNLNCSCQIQSNNDDRTTIIDVESLSFNLQDNDRFISVSGTTPFGATLLTGENRLDVRFQTDETLTQSGFWLRLHGYRSCQNNEYRLGSKCIRLFSNKLTWKSAEEQCLTLNSNLIHLYDIIQEKKLSHFLSLHQDYQQTSFWISHTHDIHSWWPWRSTSESGRCIVRTVDGWSKRSCHEEHAFICERNMNLLSIPLTVRCGLMSTTVRPLIFKENLMTETSSSNMIVPIVPTRSIETRINMIDPTILAAILAGVAMAILSMNIIVCYLCKMRRHPNSSKFQSPNESQRSLMHHLYHEQMNTISSTSTSSTSSKFNQNNMNHAHLQPMATITNEHLDYHVYETIPTDTTPYTLRPIFYPNVPSYDLPTCCYHNSTLTRKPQTFVGSESIV